jgi:hypothetical protein
VAWAAGAASIAGTALAANQARQQGETLYATNNYNALMAERNAGQARSAAAVVAEDIGRDVRRRLGSIRANAAASGIILDEGSPLEALIESAGEGELQQLRALHKGAVEGANFDAQKALDLYAATRARTEGYYKAGATLLGGASRNYGLLSGGPGRTTTITTSGAAAP